MCAPSPLEVARRIAHRQGPMPIESWDWVLVGKSLRRAEAAGFIRVNNGCFPDWGCYSVTTEGLISLGMLEKGSTVVFNRVNIGGVTVRFFFKRADAINRANTWTRSTNQQHNAVQTQDGWLVENAVTKELFDIDAKLPKEADVGPIRR